MKMSLAYFIIGLFCVGWALALPSVQTIDKNHKCQVKNSPSDFLGCYLENKNFELKLVKTQESLLGTHYHYQQYFKDVLIKKAKIVLSKNLNNVYYQSYSNLKENPTVSSNKNEITEEEAVSKAWSFLKVRGSLTLFPKTELKYISYQQELRLAHEVELGVENPYGLWLIYVDAETGTILSKENKVLPRKRSTYIDDSSSPLMEYDFALREFQRKWFEQALYERAEGENILKASGKASVFDPDPRTTLMKNELEDKSTADDFKNAYQMRDLLDITLDNTTYKLIGPYARIVDFESPKTMPSTSTDGNWLYQRGNNAFNDAMSYFHVDQSQRYIQSLGFKNTKAILDKGIDIDSDGFSGADNSAFFPGQNRLTFGHGCVDDNEDSDVILHEYGHAIHYAINNDWDGGDTGGMGEGFGDYWAGSYSISTPNGLKFFPNYAFTWDGHGLKNTCWDGRIMNDMGAKYDATKTYPAHSSVGGVDSDQLWSTPLFQSLLEAISQGIKREEMDTIVLEAHFGLGSGLKMRDMAKQIVKTAEALFPNKAHAGIFLKHFKNHKIIE